MSHEEDRAVSKRSRYHIFQNPPPEAVSILRALVRLWPKGVGVHGISKKEVRTEALKANRGRLGAADDAVRSLVNGGVLVESLSGGADVYYVDSVRAAHIVSLLRRDARDGYSEPTVAQIEQRRQELKNELIASRTKGASEESGTSGPDELRRTAEQLYRDMLRLQEDMGEFLTGRD